MSYIFFGSNYRVVEEILKILPLRKIVTEQRSLNRELFTLAKLRNIELGVASDTASLNELALDGELGICCGFGLIFSEERISNFRNGIMNIHFGKLPENRGRHPLSWSFLMNEFEIWASLHLINGEIDKGRLLHQFKIERSLDDDIQSAENRLLEKLANNLRVAIENLNKGQWTALTTGTYSVNLVGKLAALNPSEHDAVFLLNAIRSQKTYGGIEIGGNLITEAYVYHPAFSDDSFIVATSQDGLKLMLR